MNGLRKTICLLLLGVGASALLGSCQRGGDNEDTAQVTLRFATRADGDAGGNHEGMKTLRVVMYKQNDSGSYEYFGNYTKEGLNGVLSTTMRIWDVPVGTYKLYIIGNEKSVGKTYGDLSTFEEDFQRSGSSDGKVENTEGPAFFPKTAAEIETYGLPMAAVINDVTLTEGMKTTEVSAELIRAVAKLNVTLNNTSGEEMEVKQIKFGDFLGNWMYWLGTKVPNKAEDCITLDYEVKSEEVQIPEDGSHSYVFYVFPSRLGASHYTIGLVTSSKDYGMTSIMSSGRELSRIEKNKQYDILATVTPNGITFNAFTVIDWGESHAGGDINIGGKDNNE